MPDKPATIDSHPLRSTFQLVLQDARGVIEEEHLSTPIDIEIAFKSLKVTEKGIIHSRNREEQLTIRIATRVMPPPEQQG